MEAAFVTFRDLEDTEVTTRFDRINGVTVVSPLNQNRQAKSMVLFGTAFAFVDSLEAVRVRDLWRDFYEK